MATASPQQAPNPDAMKFTLDVRLPERLNFPDARSAAGHSFARQVFEADGVAALFGVNDFVTVTRTPGADWDPIITAVQAAAAEHL